MLFNKIDYYLQMVLGLLIVSVVWVFPYVLLLAIPFGAWQMISGIVNLAQFKKYNSGYGAALIIYMAMSVVYLGFLFAGAFEFEALAGVIPPVLLAIYYFILSHKRVFNAESIKKNSSGFLPNLEF